MKLTIGLQQTIVTVKQVKNRQRSDFVGQNVFVFLLLQTQVTPSSLIKMHKYKEKYTKCTEHKRVHYAK